MSRYSTVIGYFGCERKMFNIQVSKGKNPSRLRQILFLLQSIVPLFSCFGELDFLLFKN